MLISVFAFSLVLFQNTASTPSLDSGSPKEREAAIERMTVVGNAAAIPELAAALKKEPKSDLRAKIVAGLARIHDRAVVPVIADALRTDLDKDVRLQAIDSFLALYIDPGDVGTLQTIFNRVKSAVVGRDRPVVTDHVQVEPAATEALAVAMQKDFNVEVRAEAARALGSLKARSQVPSLIQAVEDPQNREHPEVRLEIIQSLGVIRDPSAGPVLRKALLEENKEVVQEAEMAIGLAGFKEARPDLDDLFRNNRDRGIRRRALEAMALLRDPGATPRFEGLMMDTDEFNRQKAVEGLARLRYDPAKFQGQLATEKKSSVRLALAFGMATGGQLNYINDIVNALDGSDSAQAEGYTFELGRFEGKLSELHKYTGSINPRIRTRIVHVLGDIADPSSREIVEKMTGDMNETVAREAIAALRKLNAR